MGNPVMRYCKDCPGGKVFDSDELGALSAEWVDSPAKIDEKPKRGRPKKNAADKNAKAAS